MEPGEGSRVSRRNVITRAVGVDDTLEVETRLDVPQPGDVYLICSDGLHGMVDDRQIASVLRKTDDLTLAVARLIERANDNGGEDNITAVAVRIATIGAR